MSSEQLTKVCVILGAGASFDVANYGSQVLNNGFRPPLAVELFDTKKRPEFYRILQEYSGAEFLARDIAPVQQQGNTGLEELLKSYAYHSDDRIRQRFKHIPPYLRDLLWECSENYVHMPGSYVQLVIALLANHPHEILFLVLNYDNLLEKAIESYEPSWAFQQLDDYIDQSRSAKVVKLHGSINWLVELKGSGDWEVRVQQHDVTVKPEPGEIVVRDDIRQVRSEVINQHWFYPVLTAPLAGKEIASMVCPDEHILFAKQFLRLCDKFLVIGSSGLDEDLLALLAEGLSRDCRPLVHFVGLGSFTLDALTEFNRVVTQFANARRVVPYHDGFQRYVSSQEFADFARR